MPGVSSALSDSRPPSGSDRYFRPERGVFRREDFDRRDRDSGNKSTANARPDDGRVAIFAAPSTGLSHSTILPLRAVRGTIVPGRRGRIWRHATVKIIAALRTVPDRAPPGRDRRHCGRQPAVRRRVRLSLTIAVDDTSPHGLVRSFPNEKWSCGPAQRSACAEPNLSRRQRYFCNGQSRL
jgi:hypothetical protein